MRSYGFALLGRVALLAGGLILSACVSVPAAPVDLAPITGPAAKPVRVVVPPLRSIEAPAPLPAFVAPTLPAAAAPVVVSVPAAPVSLDWGSWLVELLRLFSPVLVVLAMSLLPLIPGPVGGMIRLYMTETRMRDAIGGAINNVEGACRDKALTVDVGSKVLAHVLQDVADNWPAAAVRAAGGEDAIRAKAIAMLHLEADATAADLAGVS